MRAHVGKVADIVRRSRIWKGDAEAVRRWRKTTDGRFWRWGGEHGSSVNRGSRWDTQQGVVRVCLRPRGRSLRAAGDSKPGIFIPRCAGLHRELADFRFLS